MGTREEIKKQILEAAWNRFLQYGFNKTTMAEIAKDCNMSAANIYRFFGSKNDIIAELATSCFREAEGKMRDVLGCQGLSAAEKLETLVLTMLHLNHELYSTRPRISETVDYICQERFDLVSHHKEEKRIIVAAILDEGNKNGEFKVDDIDSMAETILFATVGCHFPTFIAMFSFEELERKAKGITKLIINGLK